MSDAHARANRMRMSGWWPQRTEMSSMAARAILRLLPGILCQSDGHTASAGASDDVDGATPIATGPRRNLPESSEKTDCGSVTDALATRLRVGRPIK